MGVGPNRKNQHNRANLRPRSWSESRRDKIEHGAKAQYGEIEGGEIMMQE